jgi:hypothetical protein
MRPAASGPGPVNFGRVIDRLPRRWPIATMSVAVTVVLTVLQFPVPAFYWLLHPLRLVRARRRSQ